MEEAFTRHLGTEREKTSNGCVCFYLIHHHPSPLKAFQDHSTSGTSDSSQLNRIRHQIYRRQTRTLYNPVDQLNQTFFSSFRVFYICEGNHRGIFIQRYSLGILRHFTMGKLNGFFCSIPFRNQITSRSAICSDCLKNKLSKFPSLI